MGATSHFLKIHFFLFSITSSFLLLSGLTRGLEFTMKEDVIEPSEVTAGKSEFKLWHCLLFIISPWSFAVETTCVAVMWQGDAVKITERCFFWRHSSEPGREKHFWTCIPL